MISISKKFEFAASHRLFRADWSDEKNFDVFGKCANPNGHGHNYRLEVTVAGQVDTETGMVIDASKLDAIVTECLLSEVDHKNLDKDVEWLSGKITTVENLLDAFWNRLSPAVEATQDGVVLSQLALHETGRIYATKSRSF